MPGQKNDAMQSRAVMQRNSDAFSVYMEHLQIWRFATQGIFCLLRANFCFWTFDFYSLIQHLTFNI